MSNTAVTLSVLLTMVLTVYTFMYRRERGVRFFFYVMVCRIVYAGAVIMEMNSSTLQDKLLFRYAENTALIMTVPMMTLCVLDFFGVERWIRPKPRNALIAVFALWVLLVWSDPFTGWINKSAVVADGQLVVEKSALAIALNLIAYGILALCAFFLVLYLRRSRPEIRKIGMWLIAVGSLAFFTEIVKTSNPALSSWLLPVSAYSGFCAMVMLLIIMRHRLFSIVPLARDIVMESMEEGILIVNKKGRIVDSNPFLNGLLRHSGNGRIAGGHVRELLAAWPEWMDACTDDKHRSLEIRGFTNDGERAYLVKIHPVGTAGRFGTASLLVDITDKQNRLEQIASLNGMKDRLLVAVSHDIREPLAVQVELIEELELQRPMMDGESRELVEALGGQIRNSYVLVENLLDWFRSQREGHVPSPRYLELNELVEEACRTLGTKSEDKNVRLDRAIPEGLYVWADRETVLLLLRNLIANAIKFSHRGGKVEINADIVDGLAVVSVCDDGIGMDEAQLANLFDDSRIESRAGTEGEKGAGLGLLVCLQFVRIGGGRIWAESRLGEGSVFRFTLNLG